jgi:hypothetical protein
MSCKLALLLQAVQVQYSTCIELMSTPAVYIRTVAAIESYSNTSDSSSGSSTDRNAQRT